VAIEAGMTGPLQFARDAERLRADFPLKDGENVQFSVYFELLAS
jgi:hypothetical protein